mgnify:CR=1 FL=1
MLYNIAGINVADVFDFSHEGGYQHSYFDENCTCDFWRTSFGDKRKCPANKPFISNDMSIGLSVGAYVLIGGEVSVSFDLAAWGNELISIFNDGLIYK